MWLELRPIQRRIAGYNARDWIMQICESFDFFRLNPAKLEPHVHLIARHIRPIAQLCACVETLVA